MEEEEDVGSLGVRTFVASRIEEIKAMTIKISESDDGSGREDQGSNNKLTFQHVPKHMRRRAVSHNIKRLPRRLRASHAVDVAKSQKLVKVKDENNGGDSDDEDEEKPKPKSRKFRRKPSNLLLDYNRRQRKIKWIETHIWHAKRFHMEDKWNYKIPISPCEKGYRPIFRASKKGTTMRDISFYSCLEISGSFPQICERFKEFTCPSTNPLSLGAVFYTSGQREGQMHFYKRGTYPFGYIGIVQFFWKPDLSALWLWVHPAYKTQILEQILLGLDLKEFLGLEVPKKMAKTRDDIKLEPKNLQSRPIWINSDGNIKLTDLEGALNRIRFCGPSSLQSLQELLHVKSTFHELDMKGTHGDFQLPKWFEKFYEGKDEIVKCQGDVWKALDPVQGLPCHSIIPLTVRDPRTFLPQKRQPVVNGAKEYMEDGPDFIQLLQDYWKISPVSPIFDPDWREEVRLEKMSDSEWAKLRGQMLIPGSKIDLGVEENQIPILLINQPDGIGIDLIIPAGWAMSFWVGFSYRCILPHGLRDSIHFTFEKGSFNCPDLIPLDSNSGWEELVTEGKLTKENFFKKPPDKRSNLINLSCPAPFQVDWDLLLAKCSQSAVSNLNSPNFYVLRDLKLIELLRRNLESPNMKSSLDHNEFPYSDKCLVGVRIFIKGRGRPGKDSVICIPTQEDLDKLNQKLKLEYNEPERKDWDREKLREQRKAEHRKFMEFLRKKRKKKRGQESEDVYNSAEVSRRYNEDVQRLWTPDSQTVLDNLTRDPIGFLTLGGECYSIGKCAYLGYVSLLGLLEYIQRVKGSSDHVLVRDTRSTLRYCVGRIKIVTV